MAAAAYLTPSPRARAVLIARRNSRGRCARPAAKRPPIRLGIVGPADRAL